MGQRASALKNASADVISYFLERVSYELFL